MRILGNSTLKKTGARAGGLGAALAVAATIGLGGAAAASAAPSSPCDSGDHKYCETQAVLEGHYGSALGCDNQGRSYVNTTYERAGVTYGTYAWDCNGAGDQWSLTVHQYAYSDKPIMLW